MKKESKKVGCMTWEDCLKRVKRVSKIIIPGVMIRGRGGYDLSPEQVLELVVIIFTSTRMKRDLERWFDDQGFTID